MKQQYVQRKCNLGYKAWYCNSNAVTAPTLQAVPGVSTR